jgi:saccharopine dehydrogenase-like NADP-dependent oxidoreductase
MFAILGAVAFVIFLTISIVKYFLYKVEIQGVHKRYVFITGCDTGFGNLVASTLDRKGVHVIAGCLNNELASSLKEKSSSRLRTVVVDITDQESVGNALTFTQDVLQGKGRHLTRQV